MKENNLLYICKKKKTLLVKASFYYSSYFMALLLWSIKKKLMFRRGKVYMEELKRGGCEKSEERVGKRRKNEVAWKEPIAAGQLGGKTNSHQLPVSTLLQVKTELQKVLLAVAVSNYIMDSVTTLKMNQEPYSPLSGLQTRKTSVKLVQLH